MGNGNKVEFLVAICALVTSVVAVYIAWDQGRVMRAQQHGEVFPILQVDGFLSNEANYSELGLRVSNSGVGPALIRSVSLSINGEEVTALNRVVEALPPTSDVSWAGLAGRALAPGGVIKPVALRWEPGTVQPQSLLQFTQSTESWSLIICYCSVFDRCWRTNQIGTAFAQQVPACERAETDIFAEIGRRAAEYPGDIEPTINLPSADGALQ